MGGSARGWSWAMCLVLAASGCGCGDDGGTTPADAGPAPDAATGPAAPEPPAPPVLAPCPAGWRVIESAGGVPACDPWPEGGRTACAPDEMWAPGDRGCTRIGTACPTDGLPDGLPTDRPVFYVLAGAPVGGDGTRARPLARVSDGLSLAGSGGGVVAIGVGRYDGSIRAPAGVTLWGACTSGTVLTSASGTVVTVSSTATIRNLTVAVSTRLGIHVDGPAAELTLEDAAVRDAAAGAVLVTNGASLRMTSSAIRAGGAGGLSVQSGSHADIVRAVFENNRSSAIDGRGSGSTVTLEDVVASDTLADSRGEFGIGIGAFAGASLDGSRIVLERDREAAATTDAGTLVLDWLVVRDTRHDDVRAIGGNAVGANGGGSVTASHVLVERSGDVAIHAAMAGSMLTLTDAIVRDTAVNASTGRGGEALAAGDGGSLRVVRAVLAGAHSTAVRALGGGSSLVLEDVVAVDTGTDSHGLLGRGVELSGGATLAATRVRLERNREVGLLASGTGTSAAAQDLVVRDTQSGDLAGMAGYGLLVQDGARLDAMRVLVERARGFGVLAVQSGTQMRLAHVVVTDTATAACAPACAVAFGSGIGSAGEALVAITGFEVSRSAACGVFVARGGGLDLSGGVVRENPIGACVQVPDYDLARLTNDVQYVDNAVTSEATDFAVPEPLMPVGL